VEERWTGLGLTVDRSERGEDWRGSRRDVGELPRFPSTSEDARTAPRKDASD